MVLGIVAGCVAIAIQGTFTGHLADKEDSLVVLAGVAASVICGVVCH